ncbi:MAG: hypothetical protein R2771_12300 [Saprospiraceae bacterium]
MLKKIFFAVLIFISISGYSQSFYFGVKGGASLGYQKWETFTQGLLLSYHAAGFWESYSEINPMNSLYAQLGLHNRGSALRGASGFTYDNTYYRLSTQDFIFSNLSLGLGAKKKQAISDKLNSFYSFGVRLEYTLFTNLNKYEEYNGLWSSYYYPSDDFVNKITYGATVGGGVEFKFSELVNGLIELTINPDLFNQYDQPQISGVVDPYHPSNTITLNRRRIKNTTVEITFGLKFMRKVIYVD